MKQKNNSSDLVTKGFFREELKREFIRFEKRLEKRFATKDDLKRFATKDDLQRFATKDDLKRFATKDDLRALEIRIDMKMEVMKDEIDDKARGYRDDVLIKLDEVMGELQTIREEITVGAHQVSRLHDQVGDHERRITDLEKRPQAI